MPDSLAPRPARIPAAGLLAAARERSLIGRDEELATVLGWLGSRRTRLVTLTGPSGVGKTRLAEALLAVHVGSASPSARRVAAADMSQLTDPADVPQRVADALGIAAGPPQALAMAIRRAWPGTRQLLLIDNLEQVLGCGPFLATLLDSCRGLTLLATSVVPLRLTTEQVYRVQPLAVPAVRDSAERAAQSPAVRLFVERAGLPALRSRQLAAVGEICRALGGLPLAIELAAAQARALGLDAVRHAVGHSRPLDLLTTGWGRRATAASQPAGRAELVFRGAHAGAAAAAGSAGRLRRRRAAGCGRAVGG